MYLESYRRFSFWCSVWEIPIARFTGFFVVVVVVGLRDNWVENFKPNWKLKQLHRQRQELTALASRDHTSTKTIICVFSRFHCHDFMENDSTCAHRRTRVHHSLWLRNVFFAVICDFHLDVFALWMEATNLTTINFQAAEWNVERVYTIVQSQRYKH